MRKIKLFLFILMLLSFFTSLAALPAELSPNQIRQIADKYAKQLWGNQLSPAEPIPYYSPDDKIIAYHFNYAIGKDFPDRETLQQRSEEAFKQGNRDLGWGNDEFANIVIGANPAMPVFVEYSKCLSKQYALGAKIEEMAGAAFPDGYKFGKTYYLGPVSVWFAVSNGTVTKYLNPEPKARTYSEEQFREYVSSMRLFWTRDNFEEDWTRILDNRETLRLDRSAFIAYKELMPYYEWHEGCTPSSASMLVAWWDNRYANMGNLTRYTMSRYDNVQDQVDNHVTDACVSLHNHMDTDSEGSTMREDICDGYISAIENRGYNCSSDGHWAESWEPWELFNDIKGQINQSVPVHVSIPNHSVIGIAYSEDPDMVTVHDPNMSTDRIINRGLLEGAYWVFVEPIASHNRVDVLYPDGGKEWGTNNGGETLYSGEMYEIRWDSTFFPYTYAKIYYHDEGGYTADRWFTITANTANDGSFDWLVPPINCFYGTSTNYGRIKVEIYDSNTNQMIASDGSHGNFTILPGGSLSALSGTLQAVQRTPDFFSANLNETGCWYVVSVLDDAQAGDNPWNIELYNNTSFSTLMETAVGNEKINYLVVNNYQQSPYEYGVKFRSSLGDTLAQAHIEGDPTSTMTVGTNTNTWYSTRAAEIWNLFLNPGTYYFEMTAVNADADLDISLYKSGGDGYFSYQEAAVSSRNQGAGTVENFHFSPTVAGWYGVCISSRTLVNTQFTVTISTAGNWTGAVSTDWHTPGNWSGNVVPNLNDNVTIPGTCSNFPVISSNAFIKSLTIETDAHLHIGATNLSVYGNLQVFGIVWLDNSASVLDVAGNIVWEGGSDLSPMSGSQVLCYGNWTFGESASIQLDYGTVLMLSNRDSYIANNGTNCYFYNLAINKQDNKTVYFHQSSTRDLKITGQLTLIAGYMGSASERTIITMGPFVNVGGGYRFDHGTFKLAGNTTSLVCNPGNWFYNLQINTPAQITLNSDLTLKGSMFINAGGLAAGNWHIYVGGDWTINNSPSPFNPGTGTVTFNGGQQSFCSAGNFNIMEISNNTEVHFNVNSSTCNSYVWTSGALYVDGGYLTINDLAANALTGKFCVEAGYLDITQDPSQRIDLKGEIHILGGYMQVSGGYGMSTWPSGANSVIEMSDGNLIFPNSGISIDGSTGYTLTANLTGGTITLTGNLSCTRTDFQPTGGTFKIKRANQATQYIYCNFNSRFGNLVIDSALSRRDSEADRPTDTRLETITLQTDINVVGDLIVLSGTLDLCGFTMNVGNDIEVSGSLIMNSDYDLLLAGSSLYWHPTATGTLTTGEIRIANSLYVMEGATFQMGTGTIFSFVGNLNDGYISNYSSNTVFGNLVLSKSDYVVETRNGCLPMTVLGNLTINSSNYLILSGCSLTVNGIVNASSNSNLLLMNESSLEVDGNFNLYGDLRLELNSVLTCHSGFNFDQLGTIQLLGGNIILDRAFNSSSFSFAGVVDISDGTLEITNNGIQIASTGDFNMTGGILRVGWNLLANTDNTFQLTGGTVEFIGSQQAGIQTSAANYFHDLKIAKSSSIPVSLVSNVTIGRDLIVQRGILNLSYESAPYVYNDYSLSVGRDVIINGGTLNAGRAANLLSVGRNWTNNASIAAFTEGTGTVSFVSDQLAVLSTEYFHHVNVNKTSVETNDLSINAAAAVRVSGNLNISSTSGLKLTSGSTLDCNSNVTINGRLDLTSAVTPNTFYLAGNLFDENDVEVHLIADTGCNLVFDGTADQTFGGDYAPGLVLPLCNVTVNKSAGKVLPYNPIDFMGDFTLTAGEWSYIDTGYAKNFYGDLTIQTAGAFTDSTGTVILTGSADTDLKLLGVAKFGSFTINKTSALATVILTGNAIFSGTTAIQLTTGILNVNANTLKYKGTFVINADGRLNLSAGSVFNLNDNSTFTLNGGAEFYSLGEAGNPAQLTSDTGYYTFSTSGTTVTTLGARNTIFERMGTNGINLSSRCGIDAAHRLYHCTFRDGIAGGTLLTINCNASHTIYGADFPAQGSSASNVTRTNTSTMYLITFSSWTGDFGGESYDAGAGDSRITWVQPAQPPVPLNLQITRVGGDAVLTWNAVTGATGYNVYRYRYFEDVADAELIGSTSATTWSDPVIYTYPHFYYFIKAYAE
jgi:uncharacterized Zn-binding protein involved in type VI secretion